ncbi:MAG: iron dependent repressor, metal binding and dimerization domain protein, partial [Anaerolineaceae bacterium]|nr:iron dependent repressor, metal binding and dimerization domain protein [Anaerolineaceae bacterium]
RYNSLAEFFVWMGVDEDIAFQDACRIEHYISQETFDSLVAYDKYCKTVRQTAGPETEGDSSRKS